MSKSISFGGLFILLLASACGASPTAGLTVTSPPVPTPTQPLPSATAEPPKSELWTGTADFGTFEFEIDPSGQLAVGKFSFPSGFGCGTSKVSGTAFDVWHIDTTFPPPNMFGPVPDKKPLLPVVFPVSETGFTAGPFWIGVTVPTTKQRMPFMQMTLDGKFVSDTEISGQYTSRWTKTPEVLELQEPPCSGTFTATLD